jgi:hypothetical protein
MHPPVTSSVTTPRGRSWWAVRAHLQVAVSDCRAGHRLRLSGSDRAGSDCMLKEPGDAERSQTVARFGSRAKLSMSARRTAKTFGERARHQVVNWRRPSAYASPVSPRYPPGSRRARAARPDPAHLGLSGRATRWWRSRAARAGWPARTAVTVRRRQAATAVMAVASGAPLAQMVGGRIRARVPAPASGAIRRVNTTPVRSGPGPPPCALTTSADLGVLPRTDRWGGRCAGW